MPIAAQPVAEVLTDLMNQACLIARQRSPELVTSAIRDRYSSAARCRKA
jgi:hypothetical protein